MTLGLIWAEARDRVIGNAGTIPWRLPEDLAHFKTVTLGSTVIMGRRTWDSLPERFRPLPDRHNVVVTRQSDWGAHGCDVAQSLDDALQRATTATVWVIGGATLYEATIGRADLLEVTQVDASFEGDTFAPVIDNSWRELSREPSEGFLTSSTGLRYRFTRYSRA